MRMRGWNFGRHFPRRCLSVLALWTLAMAGSLAWNLWYQHADVIEHAKFQARTVWQVDFASWRPIHGGVYLAVPDGAEANPYLDVPDVGSTVTAATGKQYRIITPPSLAGRIHAQEEALSGVRIHRTSLNPLGTDGPDAWETAALKSFVRGSAATASVESIDAQPYFRFMRPLRNESWCRQCHGDEKAGAVRGGISVAVPMAEALAAERLGAARLAGTHFVLWLAGSLIIVVFARRDLRHTAQLADSNQELRRTLDDYERVQTQLQHDAFHDRLTGLANRSMFMERIAHGLARRTRRPEYAFAVLFLDMDHFKVVNDSLGHLAGDRLLVLIAKRLEGCLRSVDLVCRLGEDSAVARLGGDEFTVFLDDIRDCAHAMRVADRIHKELAASFEVEGHELFVTVSIGIAMSTSGHERPEDILREADTAMYRAKTAGRARHQVFDSTMHAVALARLQLETDLRNAIERRELTLHYQPILSIEDRRIVGFEALARWHHPQRGLLLPSEFIPLAEETGLIVPIGEWVLREACRQTRIWQEQFPGRPPLWVSVNLSGKQFGQPDLVEQVESALDDAGLDGSSLKLEITESQIMADAKSAMLTLGKLKKLGVELSIDDFGTGYSSLSYLRRFPVDQLKIDRSFVSSIEEDRESAEIVRAITELAHTLGLGVVVEGVETAEQSRFASAVGAECVQGFFFSEPVDHRRAEMLLASAGRDLAVAAGHR